MTTSRNVYKLTFEVNNTTEPNFSDDVAGSGGSGDTDSTGEIGHVSLFLSTDPPADRAGFLFHVVDGEHTAELVNFRYESKPFDLDASQSLALTDHLGCVAVDDIGRFCEICRRTLPPCRPVHSDPPTPNCRSWLDNVVYDLVKHNVLVVAPGVQVPARKVHLRVKPPSSAKNKERENEIILKLL